MFQKIHSVGKKINSIVDKGISHGKKITGKIASVGEKVISKAKFIKPLLNESQLAKFEKIESGVKKGVALSKRANEGIQRAEKIKSKGGKIASGLSKSIKNRDLSGGVKQLQKAHSLTKNAAVYGKKGLLRPLEKDKTSLHKVAHAPTAQSVKKARRAFVNNGLDSIGKGLKRQSKPKYKSAYHNDNLDMPVR